MVSANLIDFQLFYFLTRIIPGLRKKKFQCDTFSAHLAYNSSKLLVSLMVRPSLNLLFFTSYRRLLMSTLDS